MVWISFRSRAVRPSNGIQVLPNRFRELEASNSLCQSAIILNRANEDYDSRR
jgi:hypothetical protein